MQPPRLVPGFWSRPDVGEALRGRDFSALFRLVSKYAGASQTQIAIAVGMSQSQVSNIMAGGRRVTAIDVSERVLDGLEAPDAARVAFGLAPHAPQVVMAATSTTVPRSRSVDTGSGGLVEQAVDDDVRRRDVLQGAVLGAVTAGGGAGSGPLVRIARALTSYPLLTGASGVEGPGPTVGKLAVEVARAKRDYQGCRYGVVLEVLPRLLESARLASQTAEGDELLRVHALAADAYQVAGSVMLKFGDVGLAAFAADRSVEAAARSQDPVTLAASARAVTHALMSGGHAERATEIAAGAAKRFSAQVARPDDEALSVYGALLLRGAVAAAMNEDRAGAVELLDEAGEVGRRLGRDDNAHWTALGRPMFSSIGCISRCGWGMPGLPWIWGEVST